MNESFAIGRLYLFAVIVALVAVLLMWRWHHLQVQRFNHFADLARENQIALLPVEPPRGIIYDSKGRELAVNETVYSLWVNSDAADTVLGKLGSLKEIVAVGERAVEKLTQARKSKIYQGRLVLREKLTEEEVSRFIGKQFLFPEIVLDTELARYYPLGDTAGHVIGHVGRLTEHDVKKIRQEGWDKIYRGAKFIGKTGVELIYEQQLRGQLGWQEASVDAHGRILDRTVRRAPIPGQNIYLTLDMELQRFAEALLGGESGAVVLMDVRTGALLVLASSPRFDVNRFVFGVSQKDWKTLNTSVGKPLIHRAIYGQYAPGSTIKPFIALAALHHGWRDEQYEYLSKGFFQLTPKYRFEDWKKGGHGKVGLAKSITRSVNTFYYQLGSDVGIDNLHQGLSPFGFGASTGIDLDNEKTGILPSAAWKKRSVGEKWYLGDTIVTSVGQGYWQVTPLQMAAAMAMLANGGKRLQPYVFRGKAGGGELIFAPEHLQLVRDALAAVTRQGGTAPWVGRNSLYGIAAKTGTAQVSRLQLDADGERIKNEDLPKRLRDHAWFAGYAPAKNPQVAFAVVVEHGGSGGSVAGPIARQLLDKYLLSGGRWQPPEVEEIAPEATAVSDTAAARSTDFRHLPADLQT